MAQSWNSRSGNQRLSHIVKRIVLIASLVLTCAGGLKAQSYYQDARNPDILHHNERRERFRTEIILPQVNGYNVYKADLHTM